MQDLNEIRLTGTIFKEVKYVSTQTDGLMARFTIVVHRPEPSKAVDFLSVIAWDDVAKTIKENFDEESRISIVGTVQNQRYKTQDGIEKRSFRIVATKVFEENDMNFYVNHQQYESVGDMV